MTYYEKYIKYKTKYQQLKQQLGGLNKCPKLLQGFHNFYGECWNNCLLMILLFSNFGRNKDNIFQHKLLKEDNFSPINENNKFLLPLNIDNISEDIDFFYENSLHILNFLKFRLTNNLSLSYNADFDNIDVEQIKLRNLNIEPKTQNVKLINRHVARKEDIECSLGEIKKIYDLYNYKNSRELEFSLKEHGGEIIHSIITVNIFNYFLFNIPNKFINILNFYKNNIKYIPDNINTNNIVGVMLSVTVENEGDDIGYHNLALYRCNNREYFYDDNRINFDRKKTTHIDYKWVDKILLLVQNKDWSILDDMCQELNIFIDDLNYLKDIFEISLLFIDDYKDENEYYEKIGFNFQYYIFYGCNSDRYNKFINDSIDKFVTKDNINDFNNVVGTLLDATIIYNNLDTFNKILSINSSPEYINLISDKNGPIHNAILTNNNEITGKLIKLGADINLPNKYGNTPLLFACIKKNLKLVKYLIKLGVDINYKNPDNRSTALHISCNKKDIDTMKVLIENGIDINGQNNKGLSALHMACIEEGNYDIVKLLIDSGCNINIQDDKGNTALFVACSKNNIDIIQLLVDSHIDKNIKNNRGHTIYDIINSRPDDDENKRIIIQLIQ